MLEALAILVALAVLASPVLSIVALLNTSKADLVRRLGELEFDLARLKGAGGGMAQRVAALEQQVAFLQKALAEAKASPLVSAPAAPTQAPSPAAPPQKAECPSPEVSSPMPVSAPVPSPAPVVQVPVAAAVSAPLPSDSKQEALKDQALLGALGQASASQLSQQARAEHQPAGVAFPQASAQPAPSPVKSPEQVFAESQAASAAAGGNAQQPPRPQHPWPVQPPTPPKEPPAIAERIEWERWVGVRGAALLGGITLALAGLLFFKYSIEHGLISPVMRVILGTLTGLGCLAGSEYGRRKKFDALANAVGGAGIVILYASFWAAKTRYDLINTPTAFVLMSLVTAACCVLAVRYGSLVVTGLGLIGGFATPLLLATGEDRPIGLFGYILLLDAGVVYVAHRRKWPLLMMAALGGTALMQLLWVGGRMGPERLGLGLGILGVFALVFAVAGRVADPEKKASGIWGGTQSAALLLPFAFTLYFSFRADYGPRLYPVAILMALLGAAACWIGRDKERAWVPAGASAATLAAVGAFIATHTIDTTTAWEVMAVSLVLTLLYHGFNETQRDRAASDGAGLATLVSGFGYLLVLLIGACRADHGPIWPFVLAWVLLGALLIRNSFFPGRAGAALGTAIALGLVFSVEQLTWGTESFFPAPALWLGLIVALTIAYQVLALVRRDPDGKAYSEHGAATLALLLLILPCAFGLITKQPPLLALGSEMVLGGMILLTATRLGSGAWYTTAVLGTLFSISIWLGVGTIDTPSARYTTFALYAIAVVLLTLWPFITAGKFRDRRFAWYASALTAPLAFLPMRSIYIDCFGKDFIAALPVGLGALSLGSVAWSRALSWDESQKPQRFRNLVWYSAIALCFLSLAIPLQLEKEWITIGWAIEGVATIALWRRLDHPGLKYFALLLLAIISVRLSINPSVLDYYPRPGMRIFNWMLYTYWVSTAALIGSSYLLQGHESSRLREWEKYFYSEKFEWGSTLVGLSSVVVFFVWLNLAVVDWYSTGSELTINFEREPARDLTTSIVWALYAVVLLAIGVIRKSTMLRWISLICLLITIGKVFLYDLGQLKDLYRVVSLLGLALSLILVSLAYQRFVFRKEPDGAK